VERRAGKYGASKIKRLTLTGVCWGFKRRANRKRTGCEHLYL
jgi:hypothetical protein